MKKYASFMYSLTKGYRGLYLLVFLLVILIVFTSLTLEYTIKIAVDLLGDNAQSLLDPTIALQTLGPLGIFILNMFGGAQFVINNKWIIAIAALVFGLLNAACLITRFRIRGYIEAGVSAKTREKLFWQIERLPYSYLKSHRNGDILQTCMRDERVLRMFLTGEIFGLFYTIIMLILASVILFNLNWKIALITFTLLPVMFAYSLFMIIKVRKRYREADDSEGFVTDKIDENLNSIRVVKAYNNENYEIKKFNESLENYKKKYVKWKRLTFIFWSTSDILIFGEIVAILLYSMSLVFSGEISVGTMVLATSLTSYVVWPVRNSAQILANLARAQVSIDRMLEILNVKVENIEEGYYPKIEGNIEFKNMNFKYEDDKNLILSNVSFNVKKGETIAIMGKTGSGKSTLALILSRLLEYENGSIKIDGFELKEISKEHIRKNVSLVLQEPFLFSRTVMQNLTIAKPNLSKEKIYQATKIANIHDTINNFAKGYETMVGEKGLTLSGGQRQRLAMARTLVNDSPILIFDDSLSAVDAETDLKIRTALRQRQKQSTTFIITQRTMTAKDADKIIVLENGTVSQIGTHKQLIKKPGFYKTVYEMQSRSA